MNPNYAHSLSSVAVHALLGAGPTNRRSALAVIDLLVANPFLTPDLKEEAASGRSWFVKM